MSVRVELLRFGLRVVVKCDQLQSDNPPRPAAAWST